MRVRRVFFVLSGAVAPMLLFSGLAAVAAPAPAHAEVKRAVADIFVPPPGTDQAKVVMPNAPLTAWEPDGQSVVVPNETKSRTAVAHPNSAPAGTAVGAPGLGSLPWYSMVKIPLSPDVTAQVNLGNGNLLLTAADGALSGPGLATRNDRFYNSLSTSSGSFGGGWSSVLSQIDFGLQVGATSVTFHGPTGLAQTFTKSGTTWVTPMGFNATLTENTASTSEHWVLQYNSSGEQLKFATSGYITADVNRNGVGSHYAYLSTGQVDTVTNDSGRQYVVSWVNSSPSSRIASIQDSAGRQVQYFSNSGNLDQVGGKGDGNYEKYHYDAAGRLIQANYLGTNPGHGDMQVDFTYDSSERLASVTQHEENSSTVLQSSTFVYTAGQTVVTDGNGHASIYIIDSSGRVTRATDALGHARSQSWTANSDVATSTDALGSGSNPGNVTTYSYDQLNNQSGVSYPTGAAASAAYAQSSSCPSAGSGNPFLPKCTKDDAGNTTSMSYDGTGNLVQVKDTTSGGTGVAPETYTYDNASHSVCGGFPGQICTAKDGNGNVTLYSYDSHGNLITVTPPAPLGVTTYSPDGLGRVNSVTDGNGKTTSYSYNGRDQLTKQTYTGMGSEWVVGYFGNGLESSETWSGVSRYLHYDAAGRLTDRQGPGSQTESYTHDKVGNLTSFADGTGTTSYRYDAANQLTSISEPGGSCPTSGLPGANSGCVQLGYDNNGAETSRTFPGGATVVTARDLSGRPTRITAKDAAGVVRSDIGYSYAVGGSSSPTADRLEIQSRISYAEQSIASGASTNYAYDSLNRLTSAVEKSGTTTNATWAYTYDADGNRTQQVRTGATGSSPGTVAYTYNANSELTSTTSDTTTWAYDGNGALTANGITGQVESIDARGTVTGLGSTAYTTYSPGNTEQLTRSTGSTSYFSSTLGLTSETVNGLSTSFTRTPQGKIVGSHSSTSRSYFTEDALGSVVGAFDSSGVWQGGYSYGPFGESRGVGSSTAITSNPVRYIGGYYDIGSGLYKLGARYYDPTLGRFTQTDPSGQDANPYSYAADNPINKSDSTGLSIIEDVLKIASYLLDGRSVYYAFIHSDPAEVIGALTGTAFDVACSIAVVDLSETVVGALIVAGICLAISATAENYAESAARQSKL